MFNGLVPMIQNVITMRDNRRTFPRTNPPNILPPDIFPFLLKGLKHFPLLCNRTQKMYIRIQKLQTIHSTLYKPEGKKYVRDKRLGEKSVRDMSRGGKSPTHGCLTLARCASSFSLASLVLAMRLSSATSVSSFWRLMSLQVVCSTPSTMTRSAAEFPHCLSVSANFRPQKSSHKPLQQSEKPSLKALRCSRSTMTRRAAEFWHCLSVSARLRFEKPSHSSGVVDLCRRKHIFSLLMPCLHAPTSSSEVLSELFGRRNRTRQTTRRTTRPISTSEVLMGVFWLAGKKPRLIKSERISTQIPSDFLGRGLLNLGRHGDVGQHLGRGNRCV